MLEKAYYDNIFRGTPLNDTEFWALRRAAIDSIKSIAVCEVLDKDLDDKRFLDAMCYQVETLLLNGGASAIAGSPDAQIQSESLGDYSVTTKGAAEKAPFSGFGFPVSSLAVSKLREMGLMNRWAMQERC